MFGNKLSPRLFFLIILSIIALLFVINRVGSLQSGHTQKNLSSQLHKDAPRNETFTCSGCNPGQLKPVMANDGNWAGYYLPLP